MSPPQETTAKFAVAANSSRITAYAHDDLGMSIALLSFEGFCNVMLKVDKPFS
jgi:hypothetical protein